VKSIRFFVFLILLIASGASRAIDTTDSLENPEQQALYEQLTAEVRCLVCQNQTIADSSAPLAQDLRREIRRKIEEGQTESEIKDFLTARYGDFVLYRPRFGGVSSLLWVAPGLFLVVGLIVLWRVVRQRADFPITTEAEDSIDADRGPELHRD
jgi:cytochrome c-type biogenesis protein CcmH